MSTSKIGAMERYIGRLARQLMLRGDRLVIALNQCGEVVRGYWKGIEVEHVECWDRQMIQALTTRYQPNVIITHFFPLKSPIAWWCRMASPASCIVVDDHSAPANAPLTVPTSPRARLRKGLYRLTLAPAARVVSVSAFVWNRHRHRFGLPSGKLRRIYNGVHWEQSGEQSVLNAAPDTMVRCFAVGHFIEQKGFDVLLRAMAHVLEVHAEVELVLVGDGPQRESLEHMARPYGAKVRFLGRRDDVPELLARADVVVVPSLWQEAFGYVTAEAMMAHCAVIASRTGASEELLDHGRCGVLVTPGDEVALADALIRVLVSPTQREALSSAARHRAERLFSVDRMVDEMLFLCEEVYDVSA